MRQQPLILIGASVRAAAWSAWRMSLWNPWCVDLFGDADLRRSCTAQVFPSYPRGLPTILRRAPQAPWLYTGALENHPTILNTLERIRPLWGNPAEVVRRIRSPQIIADTLKTAGLPAPALANAEAAGRDKKWLVKARQSGGGRGVHVWAGKPVPSSGYLQEWIEGNPWSALYTGLGNRSAIFHGATRQLVGVSWLHAAAFRYCGNIGPMPLSLSLERRLAHLGNLLGETFGLRGLFGVDFILQDDEPWPVEVNPRYTASVEILERGLKKSLLVSHCQVFSPAAGPIPLSAAQDLAKPELAFMHGKAIVFARSPLVFPRDGPWAASLQHSWDSDEFLEYADIPSPGTRIERGQPILTLFARAAGFEDCLKMLQDKAQTLDRHLFA